MVMDSCTSKTPKKLASKVHLNPWAKEFVPKH